MTEFKQIIGRGTRVREDYGKLFFTIMDFRGVTELFADPNFDGDPVVIYRPKEDDPIVPPDEGAGTDVDSEEVTDSDNETVVGDYWPGPEGEGGAPRKYYIAGVPVTVINERVQFIGDDGKLITESLTDYTKRNLLSEYASLEDFLSAWNSAERKEAIIEELESRGVFLDALAEEVGRDLDPFDLICHVAYGHEPVTRQTRAQKAKQAKYFEQYEGKTREVVNALIDKYADQGITAIDDIGDLVVSPFTEFGTPLQIVELFGGRDNYMNTVKQIEEAIYKAA